MRTKNNHVTDTILGFPSQPKLLTVRFLSNAQIQKLKAIKHSVTTYYVADSQKENKLTTYIWKIESEKLTRMHESQQKWKLRKFSPKIQSYLKA